MPIYIKFSKQHYRCRSSAPYIDDILSFDASFINTSADKQRVVILGHKEEKIFSDYSNIMITLTILVDLGLYITPVFDIC